MFVSCENSSNSIIIHHKHFSREEMQALEVVTPAEPSLEQYY